MLTNKNKLVEASFRKSYTHGITQRTAYVNANVVIQPSGQFCINVISAHDTMGNGAVCNLPKMIATLRMKEEILDFIKENVWIIPTLIKN